MRIIQFRGKSKKTGEWLYGFYLQNRGVDFICPDEFADGKSWEDYEVTPDTIGQFTGLYDKYDEGIYEGDIIKSRGEGDKIIYHYIKWQESPAAFVARLFGIPKRWDGRSLTQSWLSEFEKEVCGNIYDTRI